MARHRGTYKPEHPEPYEVSRSQIQSFMNCPACFWMNRVKGIKFPGMPGFLLNSATDTLLKKDFDRYREMQKPHPFMERNDLGHLVPFKHENFELWTKSLQLGLRTFHEPSNLIIGGGLDDVWHDLKTDEIFVVDYKSTAGRKNDEGTALNQITLVGAYKESYKKQMDMYQWILRQAGFNVSRTGYFVYVNGDQHFEDGMLEDEIDKANMRFDVQLISYDADDSWVEETILELKNCLLMNECPKHADSGFGPKGDKQCEYAELFDGMKEHKLI
tara:strand:- start:206 stop:1024 length:819 start_codon:yes stop_codon:yes gene_type:complete